MSTPRILQTPAGNSAVHEIEEFNDWLQQSINVEHLMGIYGKDEIEFSLETVRALLADLGHPETAARAIHVAGSKGKGSTAAMLASIFQEVSGSTGLFTSPHIIDFRERISGARGFLPDAVYHAAIEEFMAKCDRKKHVRASWFELITAFAALCFKHANAKYAVYETGMGGRLDATNVLTPEICCISRIELEHTEWLGDTLEAIAGEKAGIIKPGIPVVVAAQSSDSVRQVFIDKAAEMHAPIYFVDEEITISEPSYTAGPVTDPAAARMHFIISGQHFARPLEVSLGFLGAVQAKNAAEAALAAKILLPNLDEAVIERGLAAAHLPGRFELRQVSLPNQTSATAPTQTASAATPARPLSLILDVAHTPGSIANTIETLNALYPDQPFNLLFGLAKGKDDKHIVPLLKDRFDQIFLTRPGDFKVSDLPALKHAFDASGLSYTSDPDYRTLIRTALETSATSGTPLLVTGSFYLLCEVEKILAELR